MPTAGDEMDQLLKSLRDSAREEERADNAAIDEMERAGGQMLAPLDEAARQRIADAVVASGAPEVTSLDERRRARQRLIWIAASPLAAAAVVVLLVSGRHDPAPLPAYQVVATGGLREERGLPEAAVVEVQRLSTYSVLNVTLRPAQAVTGTVMATSFLVQGDTVTPVNPNIDVADSGAVMVRAAASQVFGDRHGRWELRILLARPELSARIRKLAVDPAGHGPGWQRLMVPLELL
jgi:hypothetical protein